MSMYSFSIGLKDLHDEYGKVFHYINFIRWKHRLYGYDTIIFNQDYKYLITFYQKEKSNEQ